MREKPLKPLTDADIAKLRRQVAACSGLVLATPTILPEELTRLLDEVIRSRALLKRIEWSGGGAGYSDSSGCPACKADRHDEKEQHADDCELAALLNPR